MCVIKRCAKPLFEDCAVAIEYGIFRVTNGRKMYLSGILVSHLKITIEFISKEKQNRCVSNRIQFKPGFEHMDRFLFLLLFLTEINAKFFIGKFFASSILESVPVREPST